LAAFSAAGLHQPSEARCGHPTGARTDPAGRRRKPVRRTPGPTRP